MPKGRPIRLLCAFALLAGALRPAGAAPEPATPGFEGFDYAFRFASAIVSDPKDRGAAQESVVTELIQAGLLDEAVRRARQIDDWRRGTTLADAATAYAQAGQVATAQGLLKEAEEFRGRVTGWQNPRIEAHAAAAHASLGETEAATRISSELAANDKQYAGRGVATIAAGRARAGDFDGAMGTLAKIDKETDFDITWWRTVGYLNIAKRTELTKTQRRKALDAARTSAAGVDGWKRAEALESIAEEYRLAGDTRVARQCLEEAAALVHAQPDSMSAKSSLLSNLARAWGRLGDKRRAEEAIAKAEGMIPGLTVTERAPAWAGLAASAAAAGDTVRARGLWDKALDATEALENARPRALSATAVCRSIGRAGQPLDAAHRARLDALLTNLKAPW